MVAMMIAMVGSDGGSDGGNYLTTVRVQLRDSMPKNLVKRLVI